MKDVSANESVEVNNEAFKYVISFESDRIRDVSSNISLECIYSSLNIYQLRITSARIDDSFSLVGCIYIYIYIHTCLKETWNGKNVLFILKGTLLFALHDLLKKLGCIENDARTLLSRQLGITKCNIISIGTRKHKTR